MTATLHRRNLPIYTGLQLRLNLNSLRWPDVIAPQLAHLVPLNSLQMGEGGLVVDLDGPAISVNRLQEMGLRIGERLRMLRPGPPHLLQVGETRFCLRPESDVVVLIGVGEE